MAMEPHEQDIFSLNPKREAIITVPNLEGNIWSNDFCVSQPSPPPQQQHTPQKPFRLLDLPPELRNAIYHAILHRFVTKKTTAPRHAQHITGVLSQSPKHLTALLQTCKQVRHEVLPLLFDAFLWTIDIRYHDEYPRTFTVVPASAWLNRPNSLSHPIDGTIRRVKLRFEFRVPRSAADRAVAKQNLEVANITRRVVWSLQIALLPREPFWAVTDVSARAYTTAVWWDRHDAQSEAVRKALCTAAAEGLERIVERKRKRGEGVSGLSGAEWKEVVDGLNGAFLKWYLGDEFCRQTDFRFIIGIT